MTRHDESYQLFNEPLNFFKGIQSVLADNRGLIYTQRMIQKHI